MARFVVIFLWYINNERKNSVAELLQTCALLPRYIVHERLGCPPTIQPFVEHCVSGTPTAIYDGLAHSTTLTDLMPYTAYEFQLYVENEAGMAESPEWVRTETESDGETHQLY